MNLGFRTAIGAAVLLAAACAAGGASADLSLEDLIAKHTEARGGAGAMDRVTGAAIDVTIVEGGQTYNVEYHAVAFPKPLARVDVIVGGDRVYSEGIDDNGVWLWDRSEPAPKPSVAEGAANALLHGVESNLVGIHRWRERGHALKLMPRETIDDVNYHVLEATFSTGHKSYFYIDPESWLIMRKRDERAYHPDADLAQKRVESRFSEFHRLAAFCSMIGTKTTI